jgi:tRNA nucleotidyltransferase/poly(A) polymerase
MTNAAPCKTPKEIVRRLDAAGFQAFWVGGCVRDFLLGREPQDYNIATDAKPEQSSLIIATGKTPGFGRW